MAGYRKAGPVTLALGLILAGCILLVTNIKGYGIIGSVLKFWPVLLIGLGAEYFVRSYLNKKNNLDEAQTKFHIPTVIIIVLIASVGYLGQQVSGLVNKDELSSLVNEALAGSKYTYKNDFKSGPIPVKPGSTRVRMQSWDGRVDMVPSTDGNLYVEAAVNAWGPSDAEAKRRAEMVKIKVDQGDVIDISRNPDQQYNIRYKVDVKYRIMVPQGMDVTVENGTGSIRADNLKADLDIKSENGSIELSNIIGSVFINGEGGEVRCRNLDGTLEAEMENGSIYIKDVTKDVRVNGRHGRIEVSSINPITANYNVSSESGEIIFKLPETSNATVSATTKTGALQGSLPIKTDLLSGTNDSGGPEHPGPGAKGSLVLGAGKAQVNLYCENGAITIDKN